MTTKRRTSTKRCPLTKNKSQYKHPLIKKLRGTMTQSNYQHPPVLEEIKIYLQYEHQKQQLSQMENPKPMSPSPKCYPVIAKHLKPWYPLYEISDRTGFSTISQTQFWWLLVQNNHAMQFVDSCYPLFVSLETHQGTEANKKKKAELSNTQLKRIKLFQIKASKDQIFRSFKFCVLFISHRYQ